MKIIILFMLAACGFAASALDQVTYYCGTNELNFTITISTDTYVDYYDLKNSKGPMVRGAATRFENNDAVSYVMPILGNNREVLRIDKKTSVVSLVTSGLTCSQR